MVYGFAPFRLSCLPSYDSLQGNPLLGGGSPQVDAGSLYTIMAHQGGQEYMSIDMMTPSEAAFCEGEIKKHWISYRERAIKEKQAFVFP